jgi:hypothetical protein
LISVTVGRAVIMECLRKDVLYIGRMAGHTWSTGSASHAELHVNDPLDHVADGSTSEVTMAVLKEGWVVNVCEEVLTTEGARLIGLAPAGLSIDDEEYTISEGTTEIMSLPSSSGSRRLLWCEGKGGVGGR